MITIIRNVINLMINFLERLFWLRVDFFDGQKVALGYLVIAFIFIVYAMYFIFNALGLSKKGEEE